MQNQQPAVRPPSLRRGIVVFSAYPPAEVLAPIKPTTERRSPLVTVLTVGRRYVNHIDHGLAVQRVRSKRCEVLTKNKNRLITIIDKEAHLEDRLPGGISTTYRQKLCDIHQVQTLKRAIGSRANYRLVIWDKRLKFSEIGIGGRELSAETVRVRAEQKAQDQALKRTGFVEYPVW